MPDPKALLAAIVDFADEVIISKTLDGTITSWNPAAERLFGYTAEEAVGKCIRMLIPSNRQNEEADIIERVRKGQRVENYETVRLAKNGRAVQLSITVSPVCDANGQIVGASKIAHELTDSRRASALLAAIVESSDDAIVSKTLQGVITSWNHAAEMLFGYTEQEAIGNSIRMIIPRDRHAEEDEILAHLRKGERIQHLETVRRAKDGSLIDISLTVSPVRDSAGRVIGASKIARDIGLQKQIEREREGLVASERAARSEAERHSRLKDEFIRTLSHELRSPIHAILGWVQLINKGHIKPEDVKEAAAIIERNARVQAQLIEDLVDLNRLTTGSIRLHAAEVNLAQIVNAATDSVQNAANAKGVEVSRSLGDVLPVMGEARRLQQIVWNLLSNSIKFTGKGGRVEITGKRDDDYIVLIVKDSGIGIASEFLPHVFDRFAQADGSTTRAYGGVGIGLSISKQLAEMHGGTLEARSAGRDQGATFTLRLPAKKEPAPA